MDDQQFPGMPGPWPLTVTLTGDGRAVAVHAGPMLRSAFGAGDLEMRDLLICSLTEGAASRARPSPPRSASRPPRFADPHQLPPARCQGTGAPDGPPPSSPSPAAPPAPGPGRASPTRDRPQAGRVPVPITEWSKSTARCPLQRPCSMTPVRQPGPGRRPAGRGDTDAGPEARGTAGADGRPGPKRGPGRARRGRSGLAGGEEDADRDHHVPVRGRDAGARPHRPDRRLGPAERWTEPQPRARARGPMTWASWCAPRCRSPSAR